MTEIIENGNTSYLDNLLTLEQINNLSKDELRILRNTIYAKQGYKFISKDLTDHFSQFSWYEGNEKSAERKLTPTDWKNIRLIKILEDYYPTKIDYILNFKHNGIYKLDSEFVLTPIYTNNTNDSKKQVEGSYYDYIQLGDFFFFDKTQFNARILFYDYVTNYYFDMGDWRVIYPYITSIFYKSRNTLVINGLRFDDIPVSVTINFPNNRFKDEIIGTTVYIPEEKRDRRSINEFTYQGRTMIEYSGIYNFREIDYNNTKYVKEHLFTAFDKNVIVILENSYPWIIDGRIYRGDPEHLLVNVIYNDIYDVYFILVINYGYLSR